MFPKNRPKNIYFWTNVYGQNYKPQVDSDFNFDDACALRMKGAKDLFIVIDLSRDTIENLEEINEITNDDEEQAVPEFGISSKCM